MADTSQTGDPTDHLVEWGQDGRKIMVPKRVYHALTAPYRGQSGFNKHKDVLELFHDNAEYVNTLDPVATCENKSSQFV